MYQAYVSELPPTKIEKIEISIDNTTLQKGERKQLQITITPQDASNHKVVYSSSDSKVAIVDDNGYIQAISSGTATITVKAEENDVQNQIQITVYSRVTGVTLEPKEIYLPVGDRFKLNGYVEPEDANEKGILYSSKEQQILTVQDDGTVTAITEGEATVSAIAKGDENIKDECKVFVVRKMEDTEIIFDSPLKAEGVRITGIDDTKNTVADIMAKITTSLEIKFVNNNDEILKEADRVGTGSKMRVKEDGKILKEYNIAIYGDANGDGKINSVDLLVIQRHILEVEPLGEIYKHASNVRKTGQKPTSVDLLLIQRHILGLKLIEQ